MVDTGTAPTTGFKPTLSDPPDDAGIVDWVVDARAVDSPSAANSMVVADSLHPNGGTRLVRNASVCSRAPSVALMPDYRARHWVCGQREARAHRRKPSDRPAVRHRDENVAATELAVVHHTR